MKWFYIRWVTLLLTYGSGLVLATPYDPDYLNSAPLKFIFEMLAFGIFSTFLLVSFRVMKSSKYENGLYRPSWSRNPFARGQVLVNFHLGALVFMTYALGCVTKTIFIGPQSFFWEIPFFFGLGVWIGARVCMFVYRNELA